MQTRQALRARQTAYHWRGLLGDALEPIHLRFQAQFVALRHEHFPSAEPQLPLTHRHVTPHRSFPNGIVRMLVAQAHPDPMSRVPLLAPALLCPKPASARCVASADPVYALLGPPLFVRGK